MQRITGSGTAFIHASGTLAQLALRAGESLKVDTGCLAALQTSVTYDVKYVGKLKTSILGGEGLFLAKLKGPGVVWLQSLPMKRLRASLLGASMAQSRGARREDGVLLRHHHLRDHLAVPTAVSEITGTLHSPQLPEAGVPVRLQFLGDLLRIEGAGTQDVMADTLEVSVIGFNDDTLQLAWQEGDGTHAVTIADAVSQRALVASAPASIARKLRGGRGDIRFHRGKWNVVIGALVTCVLLVVLVWWQSEAITAWIANRVSMETELRIGEHALGTNRIRNRAHPGGPRSEDGGGDRQSPDGRIAIQISLVREQ